MVLVIACLPFIFFASHLVMILSSQVFQFTKRLVKLLGVIMFKLHLYNVIIFIQVVSDLIELLKKYKAWQNEVRLQQGSAWKGNPENTDEKHCDNWNTRSINQGRVYCGGKMCKDRKDIDRLFTQYNGIPMHTETPRHWLRKFTKKNDLPDFNIHSLRHSNVSLMIMPGIPLPSVARLIGHSSTATTSKIYSHSIQIAEQMAIETVANVINPSRKGK